MKVKSILIPFLDGNIVVQNSDNIQTLGNLDRERDFLFSVNSEKARNSQFSLAPASNLNTSNNTNYPFLVVRSLKNDAKEQCVNPRKVI